jgi:hypothetical protein
MISSKFDKVINTVATLASHQGFYSRMLRNLSEMSDAKKAAFIEYIDNALPENPDVLDIVMFFEG